MGTFLIILGVLLAGAAVVIWYTSKSKQLGGGQRPKQLESRNPFNLRLNDVVSYMDQDFIVEGKLTFSEEGWEWYEYKLADGRDIYWMEVDEEAGEWEVALYQEVDDLKISGKPPEQLDYHGERYSLAEKGHATMSREGDVGFKTLPQCRYFDYEGPEEKVISVEQWGQTYEVCAGEYLDEDMLEIMPGT